MKARIFYLTLSTLIFLILIGCSTGSTSGERTERRDRNVITKEEIESVRGTNMYEVIDRLRPRWLTARAPMRSFGSTTDILVYQNQIRLGGLDVLRQIGPDTIESARFLDSTTASSTLPGIGGGHVAGAIVLTPVTQTR